MQNESISLYLTEGRSDKEYHADLLEKDGGFVVNFRYGRRGQALKSGTKTNAPLPYAEAKVVYDKLVSEKTKKGYSTGEAGVAYQDSSLESEFTGCLPQLLNEIKDEDVERYLTDDAWCAQEKFNGQRRLVRKGCVFSEGETHGVNKKGLKVALPQSFVEYCNKLTEQQFIIDGEIIAERLYAFDLLEVNGKDIRTKSFKERSSLLNDLLCFKGPIAAVKTAYGTEAKRALLAEVRGHNGEGIVFKRIEAPYVSGRPASGGDQLKNKFYATATCRVGVVHGSKRSVSLELFDDRGMDKEVGRVTIPTNHHMPCEGTQVEIRYLYAYRGGSLYQPTYLGERPDQDIGDARLSQLKYKPEGADEDDDA